MDVSSFISPKELLKIKREIVEQALALANPILALQYQHGILLMAENPSDTLYKVSEIYDRIAFAGTGVYNDYERLRRSGVQYADVKGFSYSRADVKAKSLATEYSTILGDIFARQQVPWEVEILVAEIGDHESDTRMYVIPFSGGLVEERLFAAIGDIYRAKDGELKRNTLRKKLQEKGITGGETLAEAFKIAYGVVCSPKENAARVPAAQLEVVVVDRTLKRDRKVRRLPLGEIEELIVAAGS